MRVEGVEMPVAGWPAWLDSGASGLVRPPSRYARSPYWLAVERFRFEDRLFRWLVGG